MKPLRHYRGNRYLSCMELDSLFTGLIGYTFYLLPVYLVQSLRLFANRFSLTCLFFKNNEVFNYLGKLEFLNSI